MNPIARAYRAVGAAFKAFSMQFARSRPSWSWGSGLGRTRTDYAAQVGDGRGNSIVAACLAWIERTLPEAPLQVVRVKRDGSEEVVRDHPLTRLLSRPNPYYSGALLLGATVNDFKATGNAYWLKVRSGAGRAVELWWVPSTLIEPKYPDDGSVFISHYEYTPNGTPIRLAAADPETGATGDVVHFRNGIDPHNPRKGLSEIAALVREVATDDEAAAFTASLLRNLGVPGMVIVPEEDVTLTKEDADQIKAEAEARFGGDNRGRTMVLSAKVKTTLLSFSPQQMDMRALRGIPEERISARLGIPAAVVGLGSGLANTKVGATMAEMREQAYESAIIPTQRLFAAEITTQLLPDLGNAENERVEFDLSEVRVLQPDLDKLHERLKVATGGPWMTPNEARELVDLPPVPGGDVLYVPINVVPTDPRELLAPEPSPEEEPPALEQPAPLRALPPPKGRKARAGPRRVGDGLVRLRTRHQAPLQTALAAYLANERELAAGRAEKGRKQHADDVSEATLRRLLESWYKRVLGGVHTLVEDALGVSFDLDDPAVRAYLEKAGANIQGIGETTREAVATALQEGHAAGEGVEALARRIRDLPAFGVARARTIARTELGHAANLAAAERYAASQVVVGVEVLDGDQDAVCADWAGRKVPIAEASSIPSLGHPNCTRVLLPILDAAELESAA